MVFPASHLIGSKTGLYNR